MCPKDPPTGGAIEIDIKIIIKCFFIIGCVLTVTSAGEEVNHETEFELLKAQIQVLQSKINYLEQNARDIRDLQQSAHSAWKEKVLVSCSQDILHLFSYFGTIFHKITPILK